MNRLLSFLLLVLTTSYMSAQDSSLLERFYKGVSASCVEMTYKYSVRLSGVNNLGSG